MRVFVAGGSGVLGRRLVPQLVARGHQVTATTTSRAKLGLLEQLGAEGILMDGLDAASVGEAVAAAQPDAIVHQMTAISVAHAGKPDMKHLDRWFATTNRLRTEGTDHLLAAADATGVSHFVAQSYANWNGIRNGGWVKTEEDPLDPETGTMTRPVAEAIRHLEDAVLGADGAVLRYGGFYGPGATDDQVELVRKRQFPLVGDGTGYSSWVHLDDAASATVLTVEQKARIRSRREKYVGEWLPEPLLTDPYEDPERSVELADSLSMAALLLLERLTPLERAVFVLREVFGFRFPEVASAVGRSEAACRQLAVRARRHMDAGRPRFEADRRERDELAARFFDVLREGDIEGLRELLSADVQMIGDGGGKAPQWANSIVGAENVARVLAAIIPPFVRIGGVVEPHELNGQPGAIFRAKDNKVLNTWTLDVLDGRIQTIRSVINPDKLGHVGPVADAWAVIREANQARRP